MLRPGRVTAADIAAVAGVMPLGTDRESPRAPGTLESHYAPRHPLKLVVPEQWDKALAQSGARRAVLSLHEQPLLDPSTRWMRMPKDPARYGHDLYAGLRALDACDCEFILVEAPPEDAEWEGIRDRLRRAATRA